MKGGGAAGVATLGAAGVEVAQSVVAETQSAILPLVPYLDTLRGVHCRGARRDRSHVLLAARRLATGATVIAALLTGIAASPWMRAALRYGASALAVALFMLALQRSGERTGRFAERLETTGQSNDVQRRMLAAAARRPRDRNELAERLRDGEF